MTRIGIVGYGNLARGVECAIAQNPDMELAAVFTRRDPASVPSAPPASRWRLRPTPQLEGQGGRSDSLRRQRHGPAHHDPGPCQGLQCHRQL